MKIYQDMNPNLNKAQKKWYMFNPKASENDMVGFSKSDGRDITLKPGDFIELTDIEIASNQGRSVMVDGTMVLVDEKKMKELTAPSSKLPENLDLSNSDDLDNLMMLDDVEFLNKVAEIKKRTFLKRIYSLVQEDKYKKLHSTIKKVEEYLKAAKVR